MSIINQTNYYKYVLYKEDVNFIYHFIKLISLSEEKIIFCFNEDDNYYSKMKCGLAQAKNNHIVINNIFDLGKKTKIQTLT